MKNISTVLLESGISLGSALFTQRKNYNTVLKIITCSPSIYSMDHADLIVCIFMENSFGLKRVNIVL